MSRGSDQERDVIVTLISRSYADPLTNAMVEFYLQSQERFTQDMQPHYVYSPREMTRWVRGICEAIRWGRGVACVPCWAEDLCSTFII